MRMTRRELVTHAAVAAAAMSATAQPSTGTSAPAAAVNPVPVRVGMTDWNLGQRGDIGKIALAREIGLDGIQVSLQFPVDATTPTLRDPATQAAFRSAALGNGIQICSLAIGSPGKSRLPLHTNPAAAILLVEAVEVARNLGTTNILLPSSKCGTASRIKTWGCCSRRNGATSTAGKTRSGCRFKATTSGSASSPASSRRPTSRRSRFTACGTRPRRCC